MVHLPAHIAIESKRATINQPLIIYLAHITQYIIGYNIPNTMRDKNNSTMSAC